MEKKFTLMKTLTAFFELLLPRSKKNSRAVNNPQPFTTGGCSSGTVKNHLIYVNDPDKSGSFLFFNQAVEGQQSRDKGHQSMDNDLDLRSTEEQKKINDELALGSSPKPVYKSWRERVNDDMAACSPVVSSESVIVSREMITVNKDFLKDIFSNSTTVNDETKTNKNDALLPFASFCSLFVSGVLKFLKQDGFDKDVEPVFIPVNLCNKSKIHFRGSISKQDLFNRNF